MWTDWYFAAVQFLIVLFDMAPPFSLVKELPHLRLCYRRNTMGRVRVQQGICHSLRNCIDSEALRADPSEIDTGPSNPPLW